MPHDYDIAARLLALVDDVDAGRPLRLKDIQDRFGVDAACASNYRKWIAERRDLVESREGRNKVWHRRPDADGRPEAVARAAALSFSVAALAELDGTPHYRGLVALADEARLALPDGVRPRLARMTRNFQVRVAHRSRNRDREKCLATAILAVEERRVCALRYEKRTGQRERYTIEPWGLLMYRDRLLLVAGKRVDGERLPRRRFFDLDGVLDLQIIEGEGRFTEPADRHTDYDAIFSDYIGIYCDTGEPVEDVVLHIRGRHAVAMRQRQAHVSQQLRELDGEWAEVRFRVVACKDFKAFVLSMLPDVRIMEPRSLVTWLDEVIAACQLR
ncbi:MAG: hypothetical protein RLZZ383_2346 [Pseudomonadota bacterium]|jgi:predicted DNA-binding transcriptional regulator YafY